jgi:tetratricopeptide (TPR) repeat protein
MDKDLLLAIKDLVEHDDFEHAMPLIYEALEQDPNNVYALNFLGYVYLVTGKDAFAYYTFAHALTLAPNNKTILVNMGKAEHEMAKFDSAIQHFLKAAEIDPNYAMAYANAAASLIQMSQWQDAEKAALLALECNPSDISAQMNLAHCYFAKGNWKNGWINYELSLGTKLRKEYSYGDETRWNGEKDKAVVIYTGEGLGDEVLYASIVNDAIKDCKKVIIDCDKRLEGLFKRSFSKADVYGTRTDESPAWLANAKIDYRCAIASLGKFYRNKDTDFTGAAYLVADPERRIMWRALFDSYKKPVIGITSHGGFKKNNEAGRTITEDDLSYFLNDTRYEFVSLDYKDGVSHKRLHKFKFATQSKDYDDTAALIAELDLVIGVNTTAHHVAGALGVKTVTLVPKWHWWRYAREFTWYKSQSLVRFVGDWKSTIKTINLEDLCK